MAATPFSKFPVGLTFADLLGKRRGYLASPADHNDPSSGKGDPKTHEPSDTPPNNVDGASGNLGPDVQRAIGPFKSRELAKRSSSTAVPDPDVDMAEDEEETPKRSAAPRTAIKASLPQRRSRGPLHETPVREQEDLSDRELDLGLSALFHREKGVGSAKISANPSSEAQLPSSSSIIAASQMQAEQRMSGPSIPRRTTALDLSSKRKSDNLTTRAPTKSEARSSSAGDTSRTISDADDEEPAMDRVVGLGERSSAGTRQRRGAAARADENLRNVVMPDVLQHEKDLKASHGDVRKLALKDQAMARKRARNDNGSADEHLSNNVRKSTSKGRSSDSRLSKKGKTKETAGEAEQDLDLSDHEAGPSNRQGKRKKQIHSELFISDAESSSKNSVVIMTTKWDMDHKTEQVPSKSDKAFDCLTLHLLLRH